MTNLNEIKTKIHLIDRIGGKEFTENFTGSIVNLKKRLLKLQTGYCEGKERPDLDKISHNNRTYLLAQSECDFFYIAQIANN